MPRTSRYRALLRLSAAAGFLSAGWAAEPLNGLMERIDAAASQFKGMTASIRKITHTAVINDTTEERGRIAMRAARPKALEVLIEFTQPDARIWSFRNRSAEAFYPKIKTVQVYDLGKHASLIDQFMLLGFGTSSKDLIKNYSLKVQGEETVETQKTTRLEMIPKSSEARQHLKSVEIWFAQTSGYPVQQKFCQSSGDYVVVTYTDTKLNPNLPDSAVRLQLPPGVKREYPQK